MKSMHKYSQCLKFRFMETPRVPASRYFDWDITTNGEAKIVEINSHPALERSQLINGPVFGKFTEKKWFLNLNKSS